MISPLRRSLGVEMEPGHGWAEFAKQVLLISCAVLFYFGVRGLTEGAEATAVANGQRVLDLEAAIGLDHERTVQDWFGSTHALTTLANWVYIWLHWPVIVATLVWLHHRRIDHYLLLRNAMFASGAIGLVIFVLLPVAPPRLLPDGFIDTVTEFSTSYRVLQPPGLVNKYAAVPSLHVGWNVIVGVVLFSATSSRWIRTFAVVSPILMAIAVVATANHYMIDGLIGAVISLLGLAISLRITERIVEFDRTISGWHQRQVVDDDPVDTKPFQPSDLGLPLDSPGEHQPPSAKAADRGVRQEPVMDNDTVDLRPGGQQQHERQFDSVACRAEGPDRS